MWWSNELSTKQSFVFFYLDANSSWELGADVAQSRGANWTLFPERSASVQSEDNAWKTTGSVGPLGQWEASMVCHSTGKAVQPGTVQFTGVCGEAAGGSWVCFRRGVTSKCRNVHAARAEMLSLSGFSVALALSLLPGSSEALREGECEGRLRC